MAIRLLVSVRTAAEAVDAVNGGADVVDVKEPDEGPLGFAGFAAIDAVVRAVEGRCPVSAALGECIEWPARQNCRQLREGSTLPDGLQFVKMGLSGIGQPVTAGIAPRQNASERLSETKEVSWPKKFHMVRNAIAESNQWSMSGKSGNSPAWISVAYADFAVADAPSPEEVLNRGADNAAGLLIDTWDKAGPSALECLSENRLLDLRLAARKKGLILALAGKITQQDLPAVRRLSPDLLAVRGAVCEQGNRGARVVPARVRELRDLLHS